MEGRRQEQEVNQERLGKNKEILPCCESLSLFIIEQVELQIEESSLNGNSSQWRNYRSKS